MPEAAKTEMAIMRITKKVLREERDTRKAHVRIMHEARHLIERRKKGADPLRGLKDFVRGDKAKVGPVTHDAYDDASTDSDQNNGDYDDSSNDYSTRSESGSNWSGSSGFDDDGEESNEFQCYCCWCTFISYDVEVFQREQAILKDFFTYWYQGTTRSWIYQQCTEWGLMLSTNYGRNMYEDSFSINFMIDMCSDIFGPSFNRTSIDNGVRNTNWLYGGQDSYNGTNVVFINGSEDPWNVLSVTPDHPPLQSSTKAIVMKGEAHAKDMRRWRKGSKDVIEKAQKTVKMQLWKWIKKTRQTQ